MLQKSDLCWDYFCLVLTTSLKLGFACLTTCACCTSVTYRRVRGELQGPSKITKHVEREVISHSNFCHVSLFLLCFAAPFTLPSLL